MALSMQTGATVWRAPGHDPSVREDADTYEDVLGARHSSGAIIF